MPRMRPRRILPPARVSRSRTRWCWSEVLAVEADVEPALERFTARRYERCRMVVDNSVRLGEMEMERAPVAEQAELSRASFAALTEPI